MTITICKIIHKTNIVNIYYGTRLGTCTVYT